MGNRIHVHIKHEIEYGEEGFNWQIDQLKGLLESKGCEVHGELNEDAVGDWEIEEGQFRNAVKEISKMGASELKSFFEEDYIGKMTDEEFKNETVGLLRTFEKVGDHHKGYYHFTWF